MLVAPMYHMSNINCDHEQYCNHHAIVLWHTKWRPGIGMGQFTIKSS